MKKLLLFIGFCVFIGVVYRYTLANFSSGEKTASVQQNTSRDQEIAATGIPARLFIPAIAVNAVVESVGMDHSGNMDVPKKPDHVAWYNLGYLAGENGNTVIAGHLDTTTGAPAVFYRLSDLKPGNTIRIEDQEGKIFTYQVISLKRFAYDNFPVKKVFGPSDKNYLNLITCQGTFNAEKKVYSHRIVVISELVAVSN